MSQPSLVPLLLLLLVGQTSVGAKDVSPFDPEAKEFSCCANENFWEPVCPESHLVKCAEGQQCVIGITLKTPSTDKTATVSPAAAHKREIRQTEKGKAERCVNQTTTEMKCVTDGFTGGCFCGPDDNFNRCNLHTLVRELRIAFCPPPPHQKSTPKVHNSHDPYCHYEVTETATGELQFDLTKIFRSRKYELFETETPEGKWPTVCTKAGKQNISKCKCVRNDCVRHKLEEMWAKRHDMKTPAPPDLSASDTGLSDWQIIGIAIGAAIVLLIIFCVALCCLCRKPKIPEIVVRPQSRVDEEKMAEGAGETEDEDESESENEVKSE